MKEYTEFRRELRCKQMKVVIKRSEKLRQVYFKGMIRAVMIRQRQRRYREYVLMAKGVQALALRVDYRRQQNNMKLICLDLYNKNLQRKTIRSFRGHITRKKHLTKQLNHATALLSVKSLQTYWQFWLKYIEHKRQRRLFSREISDYLKEKTTRQVFTSMRYFYEKRKLAKLAGTKVAQMVNTRL